MRKLLLSSVFVFICVLVANGATSSEVATVTCRVGDDVFKTVELYRLENGAPVLMASGQLDANNSFGFQFVPEYEGFYLLGDKHNNRYPIYVKAGTQSSVYIGKDTVCLDGKRNSVEMKVLYEWQGLSYTLESNAVRFWSSIWTFKEMFPAFEAFLPEFDRFKKKIKTSNARFNELMTRYVDYCKDWYVLAFYHTPRIEWPNPLPEMAYEQEILNPAKLTDDMILNMPWGADLLYYYSERYKKKNKKDYMDVAAAIECIPNQRLRGEVLLRYIGYCKDYSAYSRLMKEYGKTLTAGQQKRAEVIGAKLYVEKAGMPAPDFTCQDIDGKQVSLSDFKGKVVLIDVWATWCGPCRGELPHLKKLEEAFHGKDVVFISVSVDEAKNKTKWEKMVKDDKLEGVQLFGGDGWKSKIAMDFKINAIPRFILIDKKGNVVSVDSPRPSNPALKKLIEEELKK